MERSRLILVVGLVAVLGLAMWALWPTSSEAPAPTGRPTDFSASPSPTANTSATTSAAPAPKPSYPVDWPGGDKAEGDDAMLAAAEAYLQARFTLDYSKPWPGYDIKRMVELSTGDAKDIHEEEQRDFQMGPRRSDQEDYDAMNKSAGGRYTQTMSVYHAWVNSNVVTLDINTDNSLDVDELVEDTWDLTMKECDSEFGWCVAVVENITDDA